MTMKISFKDQDAKKILGQITGALGDRELGKMCKFDLEGQNLKVLISKLGTSELLFAGTKSASGWTFELTKEKIAFAHKPFKDEVVDKIIKVIQSVGGTVS
jgi:hypothetical protein